MSYRKSIQVPEGGWGSNMQNPSDDICRIYIPDIGKVFIQADQSGAEALIVSYLCRAGNYRELFHQSIKPHSYLALRIFQPQFEAEMGKSLQEFIDVPIQEFKTLGGWKELLALIKETDSWPHQKRYYHMGKKTIHASSYGMKAPTFQMDLIKESEGKVVLPLKECKRFLDINFTTFPEILEWQLETQQQIRDTRTLYNLQGYPRYFGGVFGDKMYKEAYAYVPQSTVGCITNLAYVEGQDWLDNNHDVDWDLLNNKHDSALLQCPEGEELIAGSWLKGLLERDLVNNRGEKFKMKSEVSCGRNWGKAKDSNPEGMKEIKL